MPGSAFDCFGRDLGDNADLVILKDAAHVPQAEVPKEYNKKVLEFLTRPPRVEYHTGIGAATIARQSQ
jgi:pimeloyl-ACP methyl ester carboxylesterase